MSLLTAADFISFFRAVHNGCEPFPWQLRLAGRLLGAIQVTPRGREPVPQASGWPQCLALPTESDRTACLDLAIFDLAAQADVPPPRRSAARRIFYVRDRRGVLDEVFDLARHLAATLRDARSGILHQVAQRLRRVAGETDPEVPPLGVAQLRGGVYRDHAWARSPTQPTIVCTDVDQLGSRLLFRGHGVSAAARPTQAGLAAYDALIFRDEG